MRHLIYYIGVAVLLSLTAFDAVYAGFGITPPYVRNDRLTKGSEFTQEIILVRGDPVEDLKAEISINVPGIEDWFTIDRGMEFILPKGQSQVPMNVTVRVPSNAPYEEFTGNIRVRTVSPDLASGVSIALGAQIDVDIRVVDKILDFEVRRVQLSEVEEPKRIWWLDYPGRIRFAVTIKNTGNAPVAPSRVKFEIFDKRGNVKLEEIENTNSIARVAPFDTKPVEAYLPTHLPPGGYLVKYSIYLEDEIKRQGELTLSVLPEGTIDGYQGYGFTGLSLGDKLTLIVPPVVLLIGILAAILISMRMKKRREARRARKRAPQQMQEYDEYEEPQYDPVPQQQSRRPLRRQPTQAPIAPQGPGMRPVERPGMPVRRTRPLPQQPGTGAPGRAPGRPVRRMPGPGQPGNQGGDVVNLQRRRKE